MPARQLFTACLFCLILGVNISFAQKTNQPSPKLMLPYCHHREVVSAMFSPDSKKIVTASADKTAMVWDVSGGKLLLILNDHKGELSSAEFSQDGKKILTASWDNMIKVWDGATGEYLFTLKGHKDKVISAHFNRDGTKIISVSSDGIAKLWNIVTKRLIIDLTDGNIKVNTAQFSPDGTKIVTGTTSGLVIIHDSKTGNGNSLGTVKEDLHKGPVVSAQFSNDNKYVISTSDDNTAKIWSLPGGTLLKTLSLHKGSVGSAQFSPDGSKVVTASNDKTAIVWNVSDGKLIWNLTGHTKKVQSATFSRDGNKIITTSLDATARIWDVKTGYQDTIIRELSGQVYSAAFSPDSTKFVVATYNGINGTAGIWNVKNDSLLTKLNGLTYWAYAADFSPDGQKIVTATDDSTAKIWDTKTGALLQVLSGHQNAILAVAFSPGGKSIVTSSNDGTTRIWDLANGNSGRIIARQTAQLKVASFSRDGKKLITKSDETTAVIWNTDSLTVYKTILQPDYYYSAQFSPDGQKIITGLGDSTAKIWDIASGKTLAVLRGHEDEVLYAAFSPDSKKIVTASKDQTAIIWNAATMRQDTILIGHSEPVIMASFSPDSKKIVTASEDKTVKVWEVKSGKLLYTLKGHTDWVNTAQFDSAGKRIITASGDNTFKIWNAENGKLLYSFFPVDNSDYLIEDNDHHFDGTENARNLLYFTCGAEKIALDQVKGDLWEPNLAERINNGDVITAKTLDQLDVCGLIPEVEATGNSAGEFQFKVTPRNGGLGETILFVNGIEARRYNKEELVSANYEINIKKDSLKSYFLANEENWVTVKAYTRDNGISSPEAKISIDKDPSLSYIKPNLYAVMVGTSRYKEAPGKSESLFDNNINLNYPAIDARAISQTIENAAKKMYGNDHVVMFNLTTDSADVLKPDKQTIKMVLDSIGKIATANDILLIFLSGHGVMAEDDDHKQFYYMTADAASLLDEKAFPEVGISTAELTDWIRPKNIRAQKRILILDACHSGQAINDMLGNTQPIKPVLVSKADSRSGMIKEIDRMNERSGLFILSASASNKSAFESDKYAHGYLTFSLLKVIKQQPDILEDGKNLNISRWFNAAGRSVSEIAKEENNDQKTQIFSVIDFNIGEVDSSVISGIRLEGEKPMFTASNFQNADSASFDDDLGLTKSVNEALREISAKGKESRIVFAISSPAGDAYSMEGSYKLKDNELNIKIRIKRGKDKICEFEEKGATGSLKELTDRIIERAVECVDSKK